MANVIECGGELFTAMLHGRQRVENRSFLADRLDRASDMLTETGRKFMSRAREAFDAFDSEAIERGVRAIKRKLTGRWQEPDIRPLSSIGEFQQASIKSQRWLMADPVLRGLVHKDRAHGYRDTYVDMEPGSVGERHTDYKRVMNGIVVVNEDGDAESTTYYDAIDENGVEALQLDEQNIIIDNWDWQRHYLAQLQDDPSSHSNGSL